MSASNVAEQVYLSTSTKWNKVFTGSATAHRQAVTAEQEVHTEDLVHEPETGLIQQFVSRDFHSAALDFQPLYATSISTCAQSRLASCASTSHQELCCAALYEKRLRQRSGVHRQPMPARS